MKLSLLVPLRKRYVSPGLLLADAGARFTFRRTFMQTFVGIGRVVLKHVSVVQCVLFAESTRFKLFFWWVVRSICKPTFTWAMRMITMLSELNFKIAVWAPLLVNRTSKKVCWVLFSIMMFLGVSWNSYRQIPAAQRRSSTENTTLADRMSSMANNVLTAYNYKGAKN